MEMVTMMFNVCNTHAAGANDRDAEQRLVRDVLSRMLLLIHTFV